MGGSVGLNGGKGVAVGLTDGVSEMVGVFDGVGERVELAGGVGVALQPEISGLGCVALHAPKGRAQVQCAVVAPSTIAPAAENPPLHSTHPVNESI